MNNKRGNCNFILASSLLLFMFFAGWAAASESEQDWRVRLQSSDDIVKEDILVEMQFGREVAARILSRFGYYNNDQMMKYINLVGNVVSMNTGRPELQFRFAILNTEDINAFAAPGGYVFVTRGAIELMADESELAGVLAHEIAHVTERHIVKELNIQATDTSAATGLGMLIGGSTDAARAAFSKAVDSAVAILFEDGYKRKDEVQADKTAVINCANAGYDPSGLIRYFERIAAKKGKTTEVLNRTHPSFAERIAWLNGTLGEEGIDAAGMARFKKRFLAKKELK